MTTITIWSECGGVGKTTTTLNLAASLGRQGEDVLIIDLDPQPASITDHAGHPDAKTSDGATLSDALLEREGVTISDLILNDELFDIVPAHESLASIESTIHSENVSMAEFLLRSALTDVEGTYDYILIDPPATLNLMVDNALIASGNVLIPMEMTRKGERSITGVLETVSSLETQLQRAQPDFSLNVLGILPNKVDNSKLNQSVQASLEDEGVNVLPVTIPNYNVMEQAWDAHLDIFQFADHPNHGLRPYQESLLDAYQDLAEYIVTGSDTDDPAQSTTVRA